jgi:FMN-dependent oxidoreductase (nitrilotriacetate monooxygenase family)
MVIGATVRTLGAWPSGWRFPGAHRNPADDPALLRRIAAEAEAARLHFLFFGDWLATSTEFEHTDPYLLARIEPFAAIGYLAAITEQIGLIATVSSSHSEPYSTARASASIDLLSGGRVGLSIASGSEPRSASNFGWDRVHADEDRIAASGEFIQILRGLWDSWEDGAFLANAETGQLVDGDRIHTLNFIGQHRSSSGPLNVLRPPQGHPPISVVGAAAGSRELAARQANLSFVSPRSFAEGQESYAKAKLDAAQHGRDPREFILVAPILPIVAPTREEAYEIYDRLVALVPVETAAGVDTGLALPSNRTIRSLAGVLGVALTGVLIDEIVPVRMAARFSSLGKELVEVVRARSGRSIGGPRPITYRQLIVAHAVNAPVVVGSTIDIADHLEKWFTSGVVDGFTVLSAFLGEQFTAFTTLVIPELQRRDLFPREYVGTTLREHLGLPVPANVHL